MRCTATLDCHCRASGSLSVLYSSDGVCSSQLKYSTVQYSVVLTPKQYTLAVVLPVYCCTVLDSSLYSVVFRTRQYTEAEYCNSVDFQLCIPFVFNILYDSLAFKSDFMVDFCCTASQLGSTIITSKFNVAPLCSGTPSGSATLTTSTRPRLLAAYLPPCLPVCAV